MQNNQRLISSRNKVLSLIIQKYQHSNLIKVTRILKLLQTLLYEPENGTVFDILSNNHQSARNGLRSDWSI